LLHFCPAFGAAAKEIWVIPTLISITSAMDAAGSLLFI